MLIRFCQIRTSNSVFDLREFLFFLFIQKIEIKAGNFVDMHIDLYI